MKNKKLIVLSACAALLAMRLATPAHATPANMGCEDVAHPVLLAWIERRAICDGPRYGDGHWDRTRVLYVPAHTTSASSYCGEWSCSYTPAQSYDLSVVEKRTYPVSDRPGAENQPLPDEPGWLPPGTDNIG